MPSTLGRLRRAASTRIILAARPLCVEIYYKYKVRPGTHAPRINAMSTFKRKPTSNNASSVRPRGGNAAVTQKKPRKKSSLRDDFLVASDSDDDGARAPPAKGDRRAPHRGGDGLDGGEHRGSADRVNDSEGEDPYANETPDERRLRLARSYLNRLEAEMVRGAHSHSTCLHHHQRAHWLGVCARVYYATAD